MKFISFFNFDKGSNVCQFHLLHNGSELLSMHFKVFNDHAVIPAVQICTQCMLLCLVCIHSVSGLITTQLCCFCSHFTRTVAGIMVVE